MMVEGANRQYLAELNVRIGGQDQLSRLMAGLARQVEQTNRKMSAFQRTITFVQRSFSQSTRFIGQFASGLRRLVVPALALSGAAFASLGLSVSSISSSLRQLVTDAQATGRSIQSLGQERFPLADDIEGSIAASLRLDRAWNDFKQTVSSLYLNAVTPFLRDLGALFEVLDESLKASNLAGFNFFSTFKTNLPNTIRGMSGLVETTRAIFLVLGEASTGVAALYEGFVTMYVGAKEFHDYFVKSPSRQLRRNADGKIDVVPIGSDPTEERQATMEARAEEIRQARDLTDAFASVVIDNEQYYKKLGESIQELASKIEDSKVPELRHEVEKLNQEVAESKTAFDGVTDAVTSFYDSTLTAYSIASNAVSGFLSSMTTATAQAFEGLINGTLSVREAIGDLARAFISALVSMVAQMLAAIVVATILAGLISIITVGSASAAGAASFSSAFSTIISASSLAQGVSQAATGLGSSRPSGGASGSPGGGGGGSSFLVGKPVSKSMVGAQSAQSLAVSRGTNDVISSGAMGSIVNINAVDSQSFEDALKRNPQPIRDIVRGAVTNDMATRRGIRNAK